MRVAYFDVECWDLSPEYSRTLCISVLDAATNKMTTFRIDTYIKDGLADDMSDDKQLLIDARDYLETFDMLCGFFTKGFDLAFVRTRLVEHGERPLHKHLHMDCCWGFRGWRGLKPKRGSMKEIARFLKFEQKPDVDPGVWMKAKAGNKKAIDEICRRCEADVRITRQINQKAVELGLVTNISTY